MDLSQLNSRLGDRFTIERELGRGGMGTVYLARDKRLDRLVALKVLPAEVASQTVLRERFLRETRMAAGFSHPNIVPVYSIEERDDLLAYAMAYVEGDSLADRVKRSGPLSIRETVKLLQDVGYALAYAHGRKVVHRDIKPDNIMIERATGRAMVMDFGIARAITGAAPTATQGLTRVGEVVGTPEYMSPEQATGDTVDGRSDLYALGLTAYFALRGYPAISGDTTGKILARQITEELPPMQSLRTDVPLALGEAIDRCVMKDPAERFQTGEELVETLDAAKLSGPEIPLTIRLLQQEQSSLAMVLLFGFVIAYMILALGSATDRGNDDMLLPIVILISVLLTRATQVIREVGRIAASGFSREEIQNGLAAVLGERAQRRAELRADGRSQADRKRTLRFAIMELLLGVLMFIVALQFRHKRPTGGYTIDVPGTILVFSAMILLGVGLALLIRSPFRRPVGERAYRAFWLGPIGRVFVRVAGRSEWKRQGSSPVRTRSAASLSVRTVLPPVARPVVEPQRLDALEQRVSDLERWRTTVR
ncbi:MAG: serine/threonine protein kinase [Gemmatimonadota bacterium]|nr:serine/threonine protein kinase [Gemmatimonadota bacterium]